MDKIVSETEYGKIPEKIDEDLVFAVEDIIHEPDISGLEFELDDLLAVMVKHEASDLHINAGAPPTVRIKNDLVAVGKKSLTEEECKKLIFSIMTIPQRTKLAHKKEVDFAYAIPDARFRVNAFLQRQTVGAAFRLLWTKIPTVDDLKLPIVIKKLCSYNNGLVLVTGPTGSGKSTTLAAMINYINDTQKHHIITVEDPIEFIHFDKQSIVTQREVGTDTESFTMALKQTLRQDPNVILLGELRDPETIMTAALAAETGHLVFATLHTQNTVQAISRMVDVFSGDIQRQFRLILSTTLRGIISQRLLTRLDGKGRIPAVEVMVLTPTIASLIREDKMGDIYQFIAQGETEGMQTFTQSLLKLWELGMVSREEILFHADHPTELRLAIEGHSSGSAGLAIQEDSLINWI